MTHSLNKKEPISVLMARLMTEAIGEIHHVSLADALEFRRDQYGLSRAQFASVIGISTSHYSEVMTGVRDLPIKCAKRAYRIGPLIKSSHSTASKELARLLDVGKIELDEAKCHRGRKFYRVKEYLQ